MPYWIRTAVRAFYCDHFVLPLPDGHRFPMEKYRLLRERLSAHPGISMTVPDPASRADLERVHTPEYVERIFSGRLAAEEARRIGFPWSPELVERSRRSVGGTIAAAGAALEDGVAVNLAGGTHHGFPDRGEGFCVFNDVAVAIRARQTVDALAAVSVVDLDVHQGNGTAAIFRDDPSVFTLSVHGKNNFPFRKEESDLDIELSDRAGDDEFLDAVRRGLEQSLSRAPDLVFYVAGADAFVGDRLGRLSVTKRALSERDELVFEACARAGAAVAVVMAGGYAARVDDTVDIHEATVRRAAQPRTRTVPT